MTSSIIINRFALKAVFHYAWQGSYEVEVDKSTGFVFARRKGITNIGLPIIEEKAKQKVQELFAAFDAACAKHKELQKTGVKEISFATTSPLPEKSLTATVSLAYVALIKNREDMR